MKFAVFLNTVETVEAESVTDAIGQVISSVPEGSKVMNIQAQLQDHHV